MKGRLYIMRENKVEIGNIYSTKNNGDFKVICKVDNPNDNRNSYYKVKFILTGYETIVRNDYIFSGYIKDPYYPRVYGVGYFGEPNMQEHNRSIHSRWACMISRCYNPNDKRYCTYGALGITVCERWHNYANFLNDIKYLPGYNDMISHPNIQYHLDKDILQEEIPTNMKKYSPETCMFIPARENISKLAINHHNKFNNKYFGVYEYGNNSYRAMIQVNNNVIRVGTFSDPIIAANAVNQARERLKLKPMNDVPYVSPEEVRLNNHKRRVEVIKIINK